MAMNEHERYLFGHTATEANGAAFRATRDGPGMARVSPLTRKALAWLEEHVFSHDDVTRLGDDVMVEMSFFPRLADGIMAAGFTFERDELPN